MGGQGLPAAPVRRSWIGFPPYRLPGDFGNICLTSTAMRLRSTSTTPEAIGRLLARIVTSSDSVADQHDDGAAAEPHYLMDGHRGGAEDHHEVDADFIEGWHWGERPELTKYAKLRGLRSPRYG